LRGAQENRAVPFLVTRLSEATLGRGALDPFLAGDEFVMRDPTFPPHPHAGFSAVTWMFEDGDGAFRNRDTFSGADARIEPGAIHWTAAGRGMLHEEVPEVPGRAAHGIQLFVDLPAALKHGDPAALHLASAAVQAVTHEGARVRVVVGAHHGVTSALVPPHGRDPPRRAPRPRRGLRPRRRARRERTRLGALRQREGERHARRRPLRRAPRAHARPPQGRCASKGSTPTPSSW
jgi:hypothetical protein